MHATRRSITTLIYPKPANANQLRQPLLTNGRRSAERRPSDEMECASPGDLSEGEMGMVARIQVATPEWAFAKRRDPKIRARSERQVKHAPSLPVWAHVLVTITLLSLCTAV